MATEIRNAKPADAPALSALALRSKAHWGYSDEFIGACKAELTYTAQQIDDPAFDFFVAERASRIAGFYALEQTADDCCELQALFVEPPAIGTGIGRLLMSHALNKAAARGATSLLIHGDPNAAGFYRAMGAVSAGSVESASIPGRLLPLFRIALSR